MTVTAKKDKLKVRADEFDEKGEAEAAPDSEIDAEVQQLIRDLKLREAPIPYSKDVMAEIEAFAEKYRPVEKADLYFARQVKGMDLFKKAVALSTISSQPPVHLICIGDPSTAKTEVCMSFEAATRRTKFEWSSKLSRAGLTLSRLGPDLMVGTLPNMHMGCIYLDEFNLLPTTDAGALLSVMQNQLFSITKAFLKATNVPAKLSIVALANPKGYYWQSNHPQYIKDHIPFEDKALLTRFHLVFIILSPSVEEFQKISRHQIRYRVGLVNNVFTRSEVELWRKYVEHVRRLKITGWEHIGRAQRLISNFSTYAYRQHHRHRLAIPISARLNEGIANIAEAYARANLRTVVTSRDVAKAILLEAKTLGMIGLDVEAAIKAAKKGLKFEEED